MAENRSNIPKHELEILARHFLPQIQAFFESEEGRKEYEEWKAEQDKLKAQTADKTAWNAHTGRERKLSARVCYVFAKPVIKSKNPNVSPLMTMFGLFDFGCSEPFRCHFLIRINWNQV